jgi:hypothetical protein
MPSRDIESGGAARISHQVAHTLRAPHSELAALAVGQAGNHDVDVRCVVLHGSGSCGFVPRWLYAPILQQQSANARHFLDIPHGFPEILFIWTSCLVSVLE